jgi:hypothetical protein
VKGLVPTVEDESTLVLSTLRPNINNFNNPTGLAIQKSTDTLSNNLRFTVLQNAHHVKILKATTIMNGLAEIYYIGEVLLPQPNPSSSTLTFGQRVYTWLDVLHNKTKMAAALNDLDGVTIFAPTEEALRQVPESASWNSTVWASVLAFNIVSMYLFLVIIGLSRLHSFCFFICVVARRLLSVRLHISW